MRTALLVTLAIGCGRMGFDPRPQAGDAAPDAAREPNLVVFLPMEDDLVDRSLEDASGNGHHARCEPAAMCPTAAIGYRGTGYGPFPNTAPGFVLDDPQNQLSFPGTFTLAAWVNYMFLSGAASIVSKPLDAVATNNNSYQLEVNDTGFLDCALETATGNDTALDPAPMPLNQWIHAACVFDGTTIRLFRDGQLVATVPSMIPAYDQEPVIVGSDRNLGMPGVGWDGLLDEVRIYDVALDAAAIAELHAR